ncbi:MAG: beta-lactamase regulating signal transducer with metallopeptidase domain, partial [Pirellulaceae bacterium]
LNDKDDSVSRLDEESPTQPPADALAFPHTESFGDRTIPLPEGMNRPVFANLGDGDPNGKPSAVPAVLNGPDGGALHSNPRTRTPVNESISANRAETWTLRNRVSSAAPWIVATWILGVAVLSVWHLAGWILAWRLTTCGTKPAAAKIQAMLNRLKLRMGIRATVRLLESTATSVPLVIGWIKPVLLMPASVLSGLPPDQIEAILAHELAHVRRHDFLVNLLQTFVETCLFYHPAVWWLCRQIRIEREYCADEEAAALCQDRDSYALALVSLADSVMAIPRPAVAATGGSLTRRIHRLLGLATDQERRARRPSWLASALLGVTVICCLALASTKSNAWQANPPAATTPIKEVALLMGKSIEDWKTFKVGDQPSVAAGDQLGFRVVLRRTWKAYDFIPQQRAPQKEEPKFELKTDDWEFVLVPIQQKKSPANLKSKIDWMKRNCLSHTRDICLGEGYGYVWFTHGTIFDQEMMREALKLDGGDDRIQLVVDGLFVNEEGMRTAEACLKLPAKFGDRAIPYIQRAVEECLAGAHQNGLWRVVRTLAFIPTERSTKTLLQLFDFGQDELRSTAEAALCLKPYRQEAKRAYLDMLRRNSRVGQAANVCVEFQWREAAPLLRKALAASHDLYEMRDVLFACRTLEGKPIAANLFAAARTLRYARPANDPKIQEEYDSALRLLIESDDTEAADFIALMTAIPTGKRSSTAPRFNASGVEILKSRPRHTTLAFLRSMATSIKGHTGILIKELLTTVAAGDQAAGDQAALRDPLAPLEANLPNFAPNDLPRTQPIPGTELPLDPFRRSAVISPAMLGVPRTGWQIAATPVTNAQYQEFLDATGRKWPTFEDLPDTTGADRGYPWNQLVGRNDNYAQGRENYPVTLVTREEANAYCRWLGSRIGGVFALPPNEVYKNAVRGSGSVSVGRDELKRLGRAESMPTHNTAPN